MLFVCIVKLVNVRSASEIFAKKIKLIIIKKTTYINIVFMHSVNRGSFCSSRLIKCVAKRGLICTTVMYYAENYICQCKSGLPTIFHNNAYNNMYIAIYYLKYNKF